MSSPTVIDPAFVAIATALYGDCVDPRELWDICKGMPDSSAVHVPSDRGRKGLAAGLVVGTAAEGLATARTITPAIHAVRGLTGAGPVRRAAKVGELGLQAGNMAVGLTAAGVLAGSGRKGRAMPVAKGLRDAMKLTAHLGSAQHRSFVQGIRTDAMKQPFLGRKGRAVPAHSARPVRGGRHVAAPRISGRAAALSIGSAAAGAGGTAAARRETKKPVDVSKSLDLVFEGVISKLDSEQRNVFGWCSLSVVDGQPVVDLQGDYIDIAEIEKSAYTYVLHSRKGGDMHRRVQKSDAGPVHTADLIESIVFTPEKLEKMGLAPDALPLGWWVGYHVNDDEQWGEVKAGRRLGFSIHGTGVRRPMAA